MCEIQVVRPPTQNREESRAHRVFRHRDLVDPVRGRRGAAQASVHDGRGPLRRSAAGRDRGSRRDARSGLFREANELGLRRGRRTTARSRTAGTSGSGHLGVTRIKVGPKELSVAAVALPTIQSEPEVGDGWVRFKQTAGGRTGAPAPRRVSGKPFFRINSAIAWTTLALTIKADGSSDARAQPERARSRATGSTTRTGKLVQKSGTIDFEQWYRGVARRKHAVGRRGLGGVRDRGRVGARARALEDDHAQRRDVEAEAARGRRDAHRAGREGRRHLPPARRRPRRRGRRRDGRRGRPRRGPRRAGADRGRPADGDAAGGHAREGRGRERRRHRACRRSRSWPERTGARRG